MQSEIWKDVPGYSGLYQVSNLGRVKSLGRIDSNRHLVRERILKQSNRGNGYKVVVLYSKGHKMFAVHRLVALAFHPNPDRLPQINHKNEIKTDNRAENLEWCTAKYNNAYGTARERAAKSHSKAVGQYTTGGILVATYDRIKDAREKYGSHIFSVLAGRRKTAGGFVWKYI